MDQRAIFGIVLCILFYLGYDQYLKTKYPDYGKPKKQAEEVQQPAAPEVAPNASTPGSAAVTPAPAEGEAKRLTPEELTIETDTSVYRFSQDVGSLESVTLKSYRADKSKDSGPVELLDGPYAIQGTVDQNQALPVAGVFQGERDGRTVRFSRQAGDLRITQEFQVPEHGYELQVRVSYTNTGVLPVDVNGGLLTSETVKHKRSKNLIGFLPGVVTERNAVVYRADGSTKLNDVEKFCDDDEPVQVSGLPVDFVGFDKHYFLNVLEPKAKTLSFTVRHSGASKQSCTVTTTSFESQGAIQPGQLATREFDAYLGPKDAVVLREANPALEGSINTGTFGFIAKPLLAIIEGFYSVTKNYGVAIVLLTLLLKVLFYPLMKASAVSMHRMKKLNPQMNDIRERYKDDRQRQQQELMKFMAQHKINPMKGCLPILPQIPVFFAFYQVLQTSIQLRHAPFFGWIQDLSAMDPFYVTPLLMGVAMFVQQKLTPTTGMDKTQEKILMFMPIMFTAMMLTLPAGLTLYMLTNTVVGIAQQKWLYRKLDKQAV